MIKVALPNKGMLFEPTQELLKACGYKASKPYKTLTQLDTKNGIEFFFLRPSDIPMYVGRGIIDAGITGIDFNAEAKSPAVKVLDLPFGASKMCAAVPNDSPVQSLDELKDKTIATSFPNIVEGFYKKSMDFVVLEGAVEISVSLGVADAIVDVVETGTTLKQAGLRIVGDPLFRSNAALFCNPQKTELSYMPNPTSGWRYGSTRRKLYGYIQLSSESRFPSPSPHTYIGRDGSCFRKDNRNAL
jgi:ATP phosphoribosyltransferase